jgi:dTMP kinase
LNSWANYPGLLVVIEGIDGAGKSSLCKELVEQLQAKNREVLYVKEPGGSPLGQKIRALLLEGSAVECCPEAEFLLFAADRAQHYQQHVIPALRAGIIVVSDRSGLSSLVYQGYGKGVNKELIKLVNKWACKDVEPDLLVLLDIAVKVAKQRIKSARKFIDTFEHQDEQFFKVLSDAFKEEVKQKQNALILDADAPVKELCKQITARIEEGFSTTT